MNYSFATGDRNLTETITGQGASVSTVPVIDEEPNHRKIRIGLALLVLVVAASLILGIAVIEPAAGKLVMFGIALFTILRTITIVRRLKRAS